MAELIVNPDCVAGKHGICDGLGWDVELDDLVSCPCACHDEPEDLVALESVDTHLETENRGHHSGREPLVPDALAALVLGFITYLLDHASRGRVLFRHLLQHPADRLARSDLVVAHDASVVPGDWIVINPDCAAGKHGLCDDAGWDPDQDAPTPCPCACHDGEGVR